MTPVVENVLETYRTASFPAFSDGISWYADAHSFALSLDPNNVERAAGVIAALSPMQKWGPNKRLAAKIYAANGQVTINPDGSNGYGLSRNVIKAVRIFNGENPFDVIPAKTSPKVISFYRSILDPNDSTVDPVIDRHAFDIAVGMVTDDKARSILSRKSVYRSFVNVYRTASEYVGLTPKQLQAVTWLAWREEKGIKD